MSGGVESCGSKRNRELESVVIAIDRHWRHAGRSPAGQSCYRDLLAGVAPCPLSF